MANAPLSFAVLHELPESVQPGFILLATATHYPVSFVFFFLDQSLLVYDSRPRTLAHGP